MTPEPTTELALFEATPLPAIAPNSKHTQAAMKRCMTAWKRAYDACIAEMADDGRDGQHQDAVLAVHNAGPAYCRALPPLVGQSGIRDFIACVAQGILIKAIPEKRANQLLYAAQVALASLNNEQKRRRTA